LERTKVTKQRAEGVAIAKLTNVSCETIGWAILWDNSELSILRLGEDQSAAFIEPPIDQKILDKAQMVTSDHIALQLQTLSSEARKKCPDSK